MNPPDMAYPRPAPLNERIKIRGCRNCVFSQADGTICGLHSPAQKPPPEGWCGDWAWIVNTRVRWESAFAGLELQQMKGETNAT